MTGIPVSPATTSGGELPVAVFATPPTGPTLHSAPVQRGALHYLPPPGTTSPATQPAPETAPKSPPPQQVAISLSRLARQPISGNDASLLLWTMTVVFALAVASMVGVAGHRKIRSH